MKWQRFSSISLMILIVLLSFFLRVYELGPNSSLNADEVTTVTRSMHGWAEIWQLANKTPLQALWIRFGASGLGFGYSEFAIYFMSVIVGVLAVVVVYQLGKLMFNHGVGLLAAFMLTFSAYHIYWSRSARYYSLMALLSCIAFCCLYQALRTNDPKAWLGYALFRLLSLYDHLTALWILAGEGVFVMVYLFLPTLKGLWQNRHTVRSYDALLRLWQEYKTKTRGLNIRHRLAASKFLWFAITMVLILIAYAPIWYPLVQSIYLGSSQIRLGGMSSEQMAPEDPRFSQPHAVLGGGWQGPFLVLYLLDAWNNPLHIVMMVAFVVGLLFCMLRHQWVQLLFTLTVMITPFILAANTTSYKVVLNGRYLISLLPLYFVMVSRGINGFGHQITRIVEERVRGRRYVLSVVLALFAFVYAGLSFTRIPLTFHNNGQNMRAVGKFLSQNARPDQLIVVHGIPGLPEALQYYLPDFNVVGRDPYVSYDTVLQDEDDFWLVFQPGIDMYTWLRIWTDEHGAVSLIFAGGWYPDIDKDNALAPAQNWDLYVVYVSSTSMTTEQALELHQDWLAQAEAGNPDDVRHHLTIAEAYRRFDRCDLAVSEYTSALNEGYVNDQLASYIYDTRGMCWQKLGIPERAIVDWQQAIGRANWSEVPYQHLGNAFIDLGKSESALALYQKGIATNSNKAWPHVLVGDYYRRHGLDEEAISEYLSAIAIEPGYRATYQRLGEVYAASGEYARVVSLYQDAIQQNPWSGWTHFQLGQFFQSVGKGAEAMIEFQKAVKLQPDLAPGVSSFLNDTYWDLADMLRLVHAYSDQGDLLLWPGSSWVRPYPFDPDVLVGRSMLEVGGQVQPNQLFMHPFSQEESTYIEFEIPNLSFTHLKAGYGLADKVAGMGNGVQYLIQVRRQEVDPYETLLNLLVTENVWEERTVSLAPYWGENLEFRLVVNARGDYDYDWLQTSVQLAPPQYPVWDLATNLEEAKYLTDELPLEWRGDGFYSSKGDRLVGQSDILVEGRSSPGQVMLHPYSAETDSTLIFTLPHQPYRTLKTSFGLADEAAPFSNGVEYTVSISTDGGGSFTDLLSTSVTTNTWRSELVGLPDSPDLVLKLNASAEQDATFDWLQVNLVLLPIDDSQEASRLAIETDVVQ